MEEEMKQAAGQGDINAFYRIIEREPLILKHIDEKEFIETPLHTAASRGCTNFAIEMLSLRPSFGRKLDPKGCSPLDLALHNQHEDTVKLLIRYDPKLIQVRGRERKTPLHYVAETNNADLLSEFLVACPTAIKEVTIRGETAVHLAVSKRCVRAFEVLIGWLNRTDNKTILDWKDNNGFTVLHIATESGQVEVVKILTRLRVNLDIRNRNDKTALDIVEDGIADLDIVEDPIAALDIVEDPIAALDIVEDPIAALDIVEDPIADRSSVASIQEYRDILEILRKVGAMKTSDLPMDLKMVDLLQISPRFFEWSTRNIRIDAQTAVDSHKGLTEDARNAFLIVTVLLVTASFQALISPPGGGWERKDDNTSLVMPANTTMKYSESSIQKGSFSSRGFLNEFLLYLFLLLNSVTFVSSVLLTLKLLPQVNNTISVSLAVLLVYLMLTYLMAVMIILPIISLPVIVSACVIAVLVYSGPSIYSKLAQSLFAGAKWIPIPCVANFIRRIYARDIQSYHMERQVRLGKYMT